MKSTCLFGLEDEQRFDEDSVTLPEKSLRKYRIVHERWQKV